MRKRITNRWWFFCTSVANIPTIAAFLFVAAWASTPVEAESVDIDQARAAVRGWLRADPHPLGASLGAEIADTKAFRDEDGEAIYYAVYLNPEGFVIVSADDLVEPIIAFSCHGRYDPSQNGPLGALVGSDMAGRMDLAGSRRMGPNASKGAVQTGSVEKWQRLKALGLEACADNATKLSGMAALGENGISELRVGPLTQTRWGQADEGGRHCYNYYTPNHYPTGCVPAMMAQLMRYHQRPVNGIGRSRFEITVDGWEQYEYTMGGDGNGSRYRWELMPPDLDGDTPDVERQAIGSLCFDAAVSVNTSFSSGGGSADLGDAGDALVDTFGYGSAVNGYKNEYDIGSGLDTMVNPNLDAQLPVALGLKRSSGGHVVLADGYGYDHGTLYHHLNLGWGGEYDAWYNLPRVETHYSYTSVTGCLYNIFPSGSGEIISGRVTDLADNPIADVTVTAQIGNDTIREGQTNSRGIYALTNLPSSETFTIKAGKAGHAFAARSASTGKSTDWRSVSGNVWGVDFVSQSATPPTAHDMSISVLSGVGEPLKLDATDEGRPDPPGRLTFVIISLPEYGKLTDPHGGEIAAVPYTLGAYGDTVEYLSCAYFSGRDTFEFVADDGGTGPEGGQSNAATVTIDVDNRVYVTYEPTTNHYGAWPFETSYHDCRAQIIYLANEIGPPKAITDLSLNIYQQPGQTLRNWTIRMKHTTVSEYDNYSNFENGGWTVVYQADEPAPPPGWRNFSFQRPFNYNGSDNLLIDFSFNNNSSSYDGACFVSETYRDRVLMAVSDSRHGDPLNWDVYALGPYFGATAVPNLKLIGSVAPEPMVGDFDRNCMVEMHDFTILGATWRKSSGQPGYDDRCDVSETKDNTINGRDLQFFVENWLASY